MSSVSSPSKVSKCQTEATCCTCTAGTCTCTAATCTCTTGTCTCTGVTASRLLESGRRHLLLKEIPDAVSDLSEACELLSGKYGDKATECSEAFFYYGKALLELSKLENVVLCNALEGIDLEKEEVKDSSSQVGGIEDFPRDEKREVAEQVAEALEENFHMIDKIAKAHCLEDEEEDSDVEDEADDSMDEATEPENVEHPMEKDSGDDGEDTDNLQLSWEVIELAKSGFQKMAETSSGDKCKEAWMKYCDTVTVLGEISLENENYIRAVDDFKHCLEKRKEVLANDSRSIAETHFDLGVAQARSKMFTEANASLDSAVSVLEERVANIKKMESSENLDLEVADLQTLIEEIKEKKKEHQEMSLEKIELAPVVNDVPMATC